MNEILSHLTDFLIGTHGSREVHGYSYVLALMSVWTAYYGAKVVKEQKQNLRKGIEEELATNELLRAVIITSGDRDSERWEGTIEQTVKGYKVSIFLNNCIQSEEEVSSWDDLEIYLREHTKFLIPDFK
ncbi:hypothetical protein ACMXYN_07225 [Neptuniibacter sp. PT8_73]|uniref:hypothetical protein n=1 Tax=Neptuniibacter sp. PT8_73 TaxID=3398206 RepID=UPI0039F4628B